MKGPATNKSLMSASGELLADLRRIAGHILNQGVEKFLFCFAAAGPAEPFSAGGPFDPAFDLGIDGNVRGDTVDGLYFYRNRVTAPRPIARLGGQDAGAVIQLRTGDYGALDEGLRLGHQDTVVRF